MNKEAVLILSAVVAVLQVVVVYLTTKELDTALASAAVTAVGAVLVRYKVFSQDTVDRILKQQEQN
jgi:hypothetical protein